MDAVDECGVVKGIACLLVNGLGFKIAVFKMAQGAFGWNVDFIAVAA